MYLITSNCASATEIIIIGGHLVIGVGKKTQTEPGRSNPTKIKPN